MGVRLSSVKPAKTPIFGDKMRLRKGLFMGVLRIKSTPMPIFFECQRCTACCRWPGQVRVSDQEIGRLAESLGLTEAVFIQQYTRLNNDRSGLALMDKPNGECVFLRGSECSVQAVKPQQCRDFPNLWRQPGYQDACKATPHEVSASEYRRLVASATGRTAAEIPVPDPK